MLVIAAVAFVTVGATLGAAALGVRWWGQYGETSKKPLPRVTSRADHVATEAATLAPSSASSWKAWLGIAPQKTAAEASSRADRATKPTPAAPVLTFYHDLTAPLTPLPRPTKPAPGTPLPPTPTSSVPSKPAPVLAATPPPAASPAPRRDIPGYASAGGDAEAQRGADDPNGRRFTIQVGAYRTRETAAALRTRLAGSGQDVYITESEGPEGMRYRVRVGSFTTEEAARAAAARLAAERQIPTYVTTR